MESSLPPPTEKIPSEAEFLKHLEILQATIARLSGNSFALRGWSVTLIAGLFALAAKDADSRMAVIGYLPVIAFWLLDAYYLAQERRYRQLFDRVAIREKGVPIFCLDTSFSLSDWWDWPRACFSLPVLAFHGTLFVTVSIVLAILTK